LDRAGGCFELTKTSTRAARRFLRLLLPAGALAMRTHNFLRAPKRDRLALIQLLQRDFMRLVLIRALPRHSPLSPRTGTSTAEVRELLASHVHPKHVLHQVVQVDAAGPSTRPAAVKRGHAMLIVQFA
jgi:hypothetical protein